jgi:hypothetical protein
MEKNGESKLSKALMSMFIGGFAGGVAFTILGLAGVSYSWLPLLLGIIAFVVLYRAEGCGWGCGSGLIIFIGGILAIAIEDALENALVGIVLGALIGLIVSAIRSHTNLPADNQTGTFEMANGCMLYDAQGKCLKLETFCDVSREEAGNCPVFKACYESGEHAFLMMQDKK